MRDDAWFGLEVQRPVDVPGRDDGSVDYDGGVFCSQDHAAQWLARPLPPPQPPTVLKDGGVDWFMVGLTALASVVLVLTCVGIWTISHAVLG